MFKNRFRNKNLYIEQKPTFFQHPKAFGIIGECHAILASGSICHEQRNSHTSLALAAFQSFVEFNPKSYQAHYRLALQLATQNRVSSALKSVAKALSLNPDCGSAFLLLQARICTGVPITQSSQKRRFLVKFSDFDLIFY